MAGFNGGRTTLQEGQAQVRFLDDEYLQIDAQEIPLQRMLGERFEGTNPKAEWTEDHLQALATTLGANVGLSDVTITVAPGTGYNFGYGHVLQVDGEFMYITGSQTGPDILPVVRGVAGTVATTHNLGAAASVVTQAIGENINSPIYGTQAFDIPYNWFQIFDRAVQVSLREDNTRYYAVRGSRYNFEVAKKLIEAARDFEATLFRGKRSGPSATTPAMMGGLDSYLVQNIVDLGGAPLTEKIVLDELQGMFYKAGKANMGRTIVCDYAGKRKLNNFWRGADTPKVNVNGVVVDEFMTDFGPIRVLLHWSCPQGSMYFINPDFLKVGHYRGGRWFDELLPAAGAYKIGHVYGDMTMMVKNVKAQGKLLNYSLVS